MTNRTAGPRTDGQEQCVRCDRTTSSLSKDFIDWEATPDGGVICPSCVAPGERQATDEADMALEEKVRENRLRRAASRQGLRLVKSRRRDPRALDFGLYVLVDDSAGNWMPGAQAPISDFAKGFGMTLDDVETTLKGKPADRSNIVPLQPKVPVKKERGFVGHDGVRRVSRKLDGFLAASRKATEGDA